MSMNELQLSISPAPRDGDGNAGHVFSVDVEDWYQGLFLPTNTWDGYETRIAKSLTSLLDLMDRHGVRATCFVLGRVAEEHPALVKEIHRRGHEVGSHSYHHAMVYAQSREEFRADLQRSLSVLEDLIGEKVIGYRAPYFSITTRSLWALDILAEAGIRYDSSIYPISRRRYGMAEVPTRPFYIRLGNGSRLLEVPVSTLPVGKVRVPLGGGGYLRMCPLWLYERLLERIIRAGDNLCLYTHPWELDVHHPRIDLKFPDSYTHYWNLRSTHVKLEQLFMKYRFIPVADAFRNVLSD